MSLLEAARQALPGIAWEQVSSNGVEYVYGEGSKDSYGVFDLADIAKITAELKADRDALDADLDETPRAVLTDELTALRERMAVAEAKLKALAGFVRWWDVGLHSNDCDIGTVDGCVCGTADNDRARAEALSLLALVGPMPAAPEVQNG